MARTAEPPLFSVELCEAHAADHVELVVETLPDRFRNVAVARAELLPRQLAQVGLGTLRARRQRERRQQRLAEVELEIAGADAAVVVVLPDEVIVVGLVADVPFAFTSNASTQTQVPPEEELLVPVTSIARVWLPEARPVTEYIFGCA